MPPLKYVAQCFILSAVAAIVVVMVALCGCGSYRGEAGRPQRSGESKPWCVEVDFDAPGPLGREGSDHCFESEPSCKAFRDLTLAYGGRADTVVGECVEW